MDSKTKCIRIEFEYENGEVYRAEGDVAEEVRKQLDSQAVFMWTHGMEYNGPGLRLVEKD